MSEDKTKTGADEGMSFIEHLEELRSRIIKSIIALFVGFVITYFFTSDIIELLTLPFKAGGNAQLTLLAPTEGFMVQLKTAFLAGLVVSSPVIFYQFWKFIAPGLYEKEKHYVLPIVFWSVLLFFIGAVFAYHILPFAMKFFQSFATDDVGNFWSLGKYITFVTYLILAFGIVFELPLILYFSAKMGLVTPEFLRKKRRHAIIILLLLAALVTPPDVFTQLVLVIPLILLYEISIFLTVIAVKQRKKSTDNSVED